MPDLTADAALASDLVRRAAGAADEMRRAGLEVERKANHADVVTAADLAAERIIVEALRERRPDDSILGEEGAAHQGTSGRTWVIDPVDGTYNFVHGLDRWCSAIALLDGDSRVLGAIHEPQDEASYVGGPGLALARDGSLLPQLRDVSMAQTCIATYLHPPLFGSQVGRAWERMTAGAATIRMLGSGSLDLVSVALGQFGAYVQHSVPPWDWHPGAALVESVGGATQTVSAAGVEWSVAGAPTAVAEICAALRSG